MAPWAFCPPSLTYHSCCKFHPSISGQSPIPWLPIILLLLHGLACHEMLMEFCCLNNIFFSIYLPREDVPAGIRFAETSLWRPDLRDVPDASRPCWAPPLAAFIVLQATKDTWGRVPTLAGTEYEGLCSTAHSFPRTQGAQERSVHRPVCSHREGSFLAKATVRVTATCIWNIPLRCDTSHGRWWSEQSPLRTQNVTLFSAQVSYKPKMAIFYLKSLLIF